MRRKSLIVSNVDTLIPNNAHTRWMSRYNDKALHRSIHQVLRAPYDVCQSHPSFDLVRSVKIRIRTITTPSNPQGVIEIKSTSVTMDGLLCLTNNEDLWWPWNGDGWCKDELYFLQKWSTTRKIVRRILGLFLARCEQYIIWWTG